MISRLATQNDIPGILKLRDKNLYINLSKFEMSNFSAKGGF